jgi:hypothetical protein
MSGMVHIMVKEDNGSGARARVGELLGYVSQNTTFAKKSRIQILQRGIESFSDSKHRVPFLLLLRRE